ncbi:Cell division and transport-associated protein TolA [Andreprevotia lacus DSM 23236]|jgi:TonB family protein|uniref:Cell division and transport-associated protein TolA n=1 Tax=Andreprevotia lacus DSM 23236 TaxID=1121001 RepID=A0A1W1Y1K1_9NEIS|nr:TonB family protein [Andreprevotia lacus]SMC29638.1 Cell division and transport-associated protein TolA [Andreprevotia lacus DSM 23236]
MTDPRVSVREEHRTLSLVLAIAIHALLVLCLVFAVRWKTQKPAAMDVELWGGPPPAAVKAPEPQPEPVKPVKVKPVEEKAEPVVKDPDIATGKAKPTPVATPKPTVTPRPTATPHPSPAPKPTAAPKPTIVPTLKPAKPTPAPKKQSTFDNLLSGDTAPAPNAHPAGKPGGNGNNVAAKVNATGTGVGGGGAGNDKLRGYGMSVAQLIKSRIVYPGSDNPRVEFKITLFPDGTVRELKVVNGDGNPQWQDAVTRAIQSLGAFPPPPAGVKYDQVRELNFAFRPKD